MNIPIRSLRLSAALSLALLAFALLPPRPAQAAITFVGATGNWGPSPVTVAVPQGTQPGDLLLALVFSRDDVASYDFLPVPNPLIVAPGGWRLETLDAPRETGLWSRLVDGTEPATYDFIAVGQADGLIVTILAYRGVDPAFPTRGAPYGNEIAALHTQIVISRTSYAWIPGAPAEMTVRAQQAGPPTGWGEGAPPTFFNLTADGHFVGPGWMPAWQWQYPVRRYGYPQSNITAVLQPLITVGIAATEPAALDRGNLDGATMTVELTDGGFQGRPCPEWQYGVQACYPSSLNASDFILNGAPAGTSVASVDRLSNTTAVLRLAYDGTPFTSDHTITITVKPEGLMGEYNGVTGARLTPPTTGGIVVSATGTAQLPPDPAPGSADQPSPAPTPGAAAPAPTPAAAAPAPGPRQLLADGVVVMVEHEAEASVTEGAPATLEIQSPEGQTAQVHVPAGALPPGSTLTAAAISDLESLVVQTPPPSDAEVASAFLVEARDAGGDPLRDGFAQPLTLQFTVPAASLPPGATAGEMLLAFWNGSQWVETEAVGTANADGSVTLYGSVDHLTIFGALHRPGRGTFAPAPADRGLSRTLWRGGDYEALSAALSPGNSVWVFAEGRLQGYIVGAPDLVNRAFVSWFPDGLAAGTPVITRR